jgi:hypothetical protein
MLHEHGTRADKQADNRAHPTYDVTTIKPHKSGDNSSMWRSQEASFEATNMSLKNLLASATM